MHLAFSITTLLCHVQACCHNSSCHPTHTPISHDVCLSYAPNFALLHLCYSTHLHNVTNTISLWPLPMLDISSNIPSTSSQCLSSESLIHKSCTLSWHAQSCSSRAFGLVQLANSLHYFAFKIGCNKSLPRERINVLNKNSMNSSPCDAVKSLDLVCNTRFWWLFDNHKHLANICAQQ